MSGQQFTVNRSTTLLPFLLEILPQASRTRVKTMLGKGQVLVEGAACTAFDAPLKKGMRVTILPKGVSIARAVRGDAREKVLKAGVDILFEDEHYLVVDKPSGTLTVATDKEKNTLYSLLNAYVKTSARMQRKEDLSSGREPDRSTAKVWIVHRLDRGTSGAVIFAKTERAKELLQSRWKELVAERKYVAWLEGQVEKDAGAIQSWLVESPKSLKMKSFQEEVRDGELAITHYRVIRRSRFFSEVEFQLETGRKNQIRVHAADLGHPVSGDEKYGARSNPIHRLALHAHTLVFRHPFTGKTVRCTAPLPESFERYAK